MKIFYRLISSEFRRILAATSVAAVLSAAATAGDLTGVVSDPIIVSPDRFGSDVSAFYLGASGGYAFGGEDQFGLTTPTDTFTIGDMDLSGAYGGIRGGWRGVLPAKGGRDFVYGFEIGYDFGSVEDSVTGSVGTETVTGSSEISDVLSFRFKNGLTNPSGRVLYFVTVGYVLGDIQTTNSTGSGATLQSFEESDTRSGFSASIGAEHKLNEDWSVTGEYEYVQFSSEDVVFSSGFSTKSTPRYHGLRLGLNYQF